MDCEHVTVTGKSCRHERLGTQTNYESLADKMCQLGFTHMIEMSEQVCEGHLFHYQS